MPLHSVQKYSLLNVLCRAFQLQYSTTTVATPKITLKTVIIGDSPDFLVRVELVTTTMTIAVGS